jgi:hypothetical protein
VKQACVLFGERLKGLRRAGVAVDAIADDRWCELFEAACKRPVLWQACDLIVRAMAAAPEKPVATLLAEHRLGSPPEGWRGRLPVAVDNVAVKLYRRPRSWDRPAAGFEHAPAASGIGRPELAGGQTPTSTSDAGHRTSDDARSLQSTSDAGHRTPDDLDRLFRFAMGHAMRDLRGRVPALDVADAVRTEIAAR